MKKIICLVILTLLVTSGSVLAQPDYKFESKLEMDRVSVGNPVYMYLTFYGRQDIDPPKTQDLDGVRIRYIGPSTKMSVVNGRVSQSITYTYLVIPLKKGNFTLGPFYTEHDGKVYQSNPVILNASDIPGPATSSSPPPRRGPITAPPPPAGRSYQKQSYDDDRLFLTMEVAKTTVYVNEMVPIIIKVYVDAMGLKDIEFPTYSHEGFSTGEFTEPERTRERRRGSSYDVLVFRQDLFAIKEGDYLLGPAKLNCKAVFRKQTARRRSLFGRSVFDDDFFSNSFGYSTYPVELEADSIEMTIRPFPDAGRPVNFQGAVGAFRNLA